MTTRIGKDAISNYSGTAITSSNTGGADQVSNVYVVGFNQALYHDRGQYANINNLRFDSNNGIWISHSHAVAYINGARGWSYYNSNTNWSKSQYVVGNVADDGSGHIKVTGTTTPSTIAAGDIIKIDSVSGYYGVNNRCEWQAFPGAISYC